MAKKRRRKVVPLERPLERVGRLIAKATLILSGEPTPLPPICSARRRGELLSRRRERLSLFHDVGSQDFGLALAGVDAFMHEAGRHEESLASLDHSRRLAIDTQLDLPLQNVGELLSEMRMAAGRDTRVELAADLY